MADNEDQERKGKTEAGPSMGRASASGVRTRSTKEGRSDEAEASVSCNHEDRDKKRITRKTEIYLWRGKERVRIEGGC